MKTNQNDYVLIWNGKTMHKDGTRFTKKVSKESWLLLPKAKPDGSRGGFFIVEDYESTNKINTLIAEKKAKEIIAGTVIPVKEITKVKVEEVKAPVIDDISGNMEISKAGTPLPNDEGNVPSTNTAPKPKATPGRKPKAKK